MITCTSWCEDRSSNTEAHHIRKDTPNSWPLLLELAFSSAELLCNQITICGKIATLNLIRYQLSVSRSSKNFLSGSLLNVVLITSKWICLIMWYWLCLRKLKQLSDKDIEINSLYCGLKCEQKRSKVRAVVTCGVWTYLALALIITSSILWLLVFELALFRESGAGWLWSKSWIPNLWRSWKPIALLGEVLLTPSPRKPLLLKGFVQPKNAINLLK